MKRAEAAPKPRRDAVGEQVSAVQAAFRSRSPLPVVIATRTLAAGIDLCAHTVILHGWQPTSAGAYVLGISKVRSHIVIWNQHKGLSAAQGLSLDFN